MTPKPPPKPLIGMTELCQILDREPGTIRGWEASKKLPKSLLPKRDDRNHRYWTPAQVHGSRGLLRWMERNDMRPGKLMTDPSKESQHVHNLRRPKLLDGDKIRGIKIMVENGWDREHILKKVFPRTEYSTKEGLEKALVRYFKLNGWNFPPKKRRPYPTRAMRMERARLTGTPLYDMTTRRAKAKAARRRRKRNQ